MIFPINRLRMIPEMPCFTWESHQEALDSPTYRTHLQRLCLMLADCYSSSQVLLVGHIAPKSWRCPSAIAFGAKMARYLERAPRGAFVYSPGEEVTWCGYHRLLTTSYFVNWVSELASTYCGTSVGGHCVCVCAPVPEWRNVRLDEDKMGPIWAFSV